MELNGSKIKKKFDFQYASKGQQEWIISYQTAISLFTFHLSVAREVITDTFIEENNIYQVSSIDRSIFLPTLSSRKL